MKIYLAGPWKERDKMPAIAEKIEEFGHEITHRWWLVDEAGENDASKVPYLREMAERDVQAVRDAELVIVINSAKSEGKAIEQGVAIALHKPIIAVGKRGEHSANVFHYLNTYLWVSDVDKLYEVFSVINWALHV